MSEKRVSLAVKYRPQTMEDVSEQSSIRIILENQIRTNNLKHAYLFCGGAGTGKTTSARILANMINEGNGNPVELDCASNNGVDDMRSIQEACKFRPLDSKYKVFILDECHMITPQGWNSMLKILEEPPEYVIFLFCTTDPQKIIGTIMSRVQRFNFQRISTKGISDRLKYILSKENISNYDESAVEYIARLAKGGMRDAITTLEKCLDYSTDLTLDNVYKVTSGGVTEQTMLSFMQLILNVNPKDCLVSFNNIYMSGIDINLFLKLYIEFLENCVKFLITESSDIVSLSDIVINWLLNNKQFIEPIRNQLINLINIKSNYSSEDLKILLESWIVQECK